MEKIHNNSRAMAVTQQVMKYQFQGLCMNCTHQKTCTLQKNKEPILYCEEYE